MTLLEFIFQDLPHFLGSCILLFIIWGALYDILTAIGSWFR